MIFNKFQRTIFLNIKIKPLGEIYYGFNDIGRNNKQVGY